MAEHKFLLRTDKTTWNKWREFAEQHGMTLKGLIIVAVKKYIIDNGG